MREVRWERMFPDELERAFAERPLVYFAYGLCEPHGPQNTLGLDTLKAHAIVCQAARAAGGIVAPPDYWHIHELGGYADWAHQAVGQVERTWLTAVPPWVHFKNICYHLRAVEVLGFHAAILLTGHYGPNWEDLKRLITLVQPHIGTRLYALPDFEANRSGFTNDGTSSGDHAGRVETSLLWALAPDCVDISRVPPVESVGPHFAMGPDVREANRLVGERMVDDEVRWLTAKAEELLTAYTQLQPRHTLRRFEDVEVLWETIVKPELKQFRSMQQHWNDQEGWNDQQVVPTSSVWFENAAVPDRG